MKNKEKILLTGSKGFIGSYFLEKYNCKYDIKTFSFRNDDFELLNLSDIDTVIHLSALVHQMGGAEKVEYEKINVTQTLDLAKKAKESGVTHFVFMSTVKVYGEESDLPYNENSVCNPKDDYGESKLKAEKELLKLSSEKFKISVIRTSIVYGFGVKANIKNLVNLIKKVPGLPFGRIENKRSMVYVGNLCHLIDVIIQKSAEGIFLACDDRAISTTELIKLIAKNLDKKIYLFKIPFFESFLKLFKPDIHKRLYGNLVVDNTQTKQKLNYENIYSVEEGIKFMIQGEK